LSVLRLIPNSLFSTAASSFLITSLLCPTFKDGRSANTVIYSNLRTFLDKRTFRKYENLRISDFWIFHLRTLPFLESCEFFDLRNQFLLTSANRKYLIFYNKNCWLKKLSFKFVLTRKIGLYEYNMRANCRWNCRNSTKEGVELFKRNVSSLVFICEKCEDLR
jgi:hypothetical protein